MSPKPKEYFTTAPALMRNLPSQEPTKKKEKKKKDSRENKKREIIVVSEIVQKREK
tara:strand:- start:2053 stop:2220 length:168 start_codon:yes stop_codon:yes gene_type:complete